MSAVEWIIVVFGAITGYGLVGAVLTRRKPPSVPASPHWTQVLGLPPDAGVPDIEVAASRLAEEISQSHAADPRLPDMLRRVAEVRAAALAERSP